MSKLGQIREALRSKKLRLDVEDTAPWPRLTPDERILLLRKCGEPCFLRTVGTLQEKLADPKKNLKFPICRPTNRSRSCAISASGLLAASRRARLTKKYPDIVSDTETLIRQFGTTKKARAEDITIHTLRIKPSALAEDKFDVVIVYTNKAQDPLRKPLTAKTIIKKYGEFLTPRHHNILGL